LPAGFALGSCDDRGRGQESEQIKQRPVAEWLELAERSDVDPSAASGEQAANTSNGASDQHSGHEGVCGCHRGHANDPRAQDGAEEDPPVSAERSEPDVQPSERKPHALDRQPLSVKPRTCDT